MFLVWSCGSNDNILPDQNKNFERYFDSKNVEYVVQGGVYKHIGNADRVGYESATEVAQGDNITMYFEAYTFGTSQQALFYTNKESLLSQATGLNTQFWSTDPLQVKLGETTLIDGLNRGLSGCREGDSVVLLINYELAFKDKAVGVVPKNSAIMYILNIKTVTK